MLQRSNYSHYSGVNSLQHVLYSESKFHDERSDWALYKGLAVVQSRKPKMHDSLKRVQFYVLQDSGWNLRVIIPNLRVIIPNLRVIIPNLAVFHQNLRNQGAPQ